MTASYNSVMCSKRSPVLFTTIVWKFSLMFHLILGSQLTYTSFYYTYVRVAIMSARYPATGQLRAVTSGTLCIVMMSSEQIKQTELI